MCLVSLTLWSICRSAVLFSVTVFFPKNTRGNILNLVSQKKLEMSNKRNKEIINQDSESEEEQDSGSEKDSDFDSDGNFVGDKVWENIT